MSKASDFIRTSSFTAGGSLEVTRTAGETLSRGDFVGTDANNQLVKMHIDQLASPLGSLGFSYDTGTTFHSATINSNTILIAFTDANDSSKLRVVAMTFPTTFNSNTIPTVSNVLGLTSGYTTIYKVIKVSTNRAVIFYVAQAAQAELRTAVITYTNGTLTYYGGQTQTVPTLISWQMDVALYADNAIALVLTGGSSGALHTYIFSAVVSQYNVVYSSGQGLIYNQQSMDVGIIPLDSTRVLASYYSNTNGYKCKVVTIATPGANPSLSTTEYSNSVRHVKAIKIQDGKIVLLYGSTTNIITMAGDASITFGNTLATLASNNAVLYDTNTILVVANNGTYQKIDVSGDTPTNIINDCKFYIPAVINTISDMLVNSNGEIMTVCNASDGTDYKFHALCFEPLTNKMPLRYVGMAKEAYSQGTEATAVIGGIVESTSREYRQNYYYHDSTRPYAIQFSNRAADGVMAQKIDNNTMFVY